jgi:hypothetical protein
MIPAISVVVVVFLSVLITRIATIALTHTGLSKESAKFQSRSALSGSGFTTNESEHVVNHPIRRKIIMLLMLIGNAGLVTVMSSFILTFVHSDSQNSILTSMLIIVFGLLLIWWVGNSRSVDKFLSKIIDKGLNRYTSLSIYDYNSLLHLSDDYRIVELYVNKEDWVANKTIGDLKLNEEGILVLAIQRKDGKYISAPTTSKMIMDGDVLTIYGTASACNSLDSRTRGLSGDKEHKKAASEYSKLNHS